MTLDGGLAVHHAELGLVLCDAQVVPRHDGDHREGSTFRLPALGAAAGVIVRDLPLDGDANLIRGTLAGKRATGELAVARLYALVDGRVQADVVRHVNLSLCKSLAPATHAVGPSSFHRTAGQA
jgi:hypothetical protein